MSIRVHLTPVLFGLLCAAFGLAAVAIAWTPLTVGCVASSLIVYGSQHPRGSHCIPYTDGGLPVVLQSDPATGRAIVAAALLTVVVALGALWFRRGHRVGGQRMVWAATMLLALALAWPVVFSHLGLLSALFVPSFVCALLAAATTFRPAPVPFRNGL
jgi:hypothetical protein